MILITVIRKTGNPLSVGAGFLFYAAFRRLKVYEKALTP